MEIIIPITAATINLITELNGGVRPEFESDQTFFVWRGPTFAPNIIDFNKFDRLTKDRSAHTMTTIRSKVTYE
jgi:hypothetical protein